MKKNTTGIVLLALGLLLYIAYWVILLQPIQSKFAGTGDYPAFMICIISAIVAGLIASTGTYVGSALMKDKDFGVKHTDFTFGQLFSSKAYFLYSACWVGATILFTIFWRNEL